MALTWDDLELLDRIAATGTLTAAGRALGVDQTTASRRLARIEKHLGITLFDRIDGRLVGTSALADAQASLRAMAEAAGRAEAALRRTRAELEGRVRVSSVGFVLTHVLGPELPVLRQAHPRLSIDLVAENRNASFERREADLSLRLGRPQDEPAIVRRLAAVRFRLYRGGAGEGAVPVMRYDDLPDLPEMRFLDALRPGAAVALRANRLELLQAGAAAGGEAVLPEIVGDADPRLGRVETTPAAIERELFLLVHPDRRRVPSVASVLDWIEQAVANRLKVVTIEPTDRLTS